MKRAATVLAAALAATLGAPSAVAQQSPVRECGDVDRGETGIKNLTARGVTCRRARRVARTHPRDETPLGFRCRSRDVARYTYDIRCTRGSNVVRWQYNSD